MPRLFSSSMLAVLVALVAVVAADDFLDQEMSGFVTTYKIPAGGVWQSFTPSYTANLTSVGLMIGATFKSVPCVPFSGTIKVYQGVGKKGVSGPFFVAQQPLTQQVVVSNDCRCNNDDCVSWQKFELSVPVTIVGGEVYSFHIIPATTSTSFRVGLMVVDTYSRGENNFAAPGYDYPFKTYMHAQQSETLTLTGDKGTNDQATTISSKSSSSTTVVVVIAVVTALAVLVAVIVVVIRRRRRDGEWLSAEDAINVWKNRFAGKDMEPPVKKHDRSRVYVIKEEAAKPEDKPEGAIHDNWVKEQWQRYTVRAEAGDSLRWREKTTIALPDSLQFESTVDMPEYDPEADNLDNIELPEQYDDHGHETVMLY